MKMVQYKDALQTPDKIIPENITHYDSIEEVLNYHNELYKPRERQLPRLDPLVFEVTAENTGYLYDTVETIKEDCSKYGFVNMPNMARFFEIIQTNMTVEVVVDDDDAISGISEDEVVVETTAPTS